MEMTKGVISLNIDSDLILLINKTDNKSSFVNKILRQHLQTENQLEKEIKETQKHLQKLLKKREQITIRQEQFLDNVPKEYLNSIKPPQLTAEEKVKGIQRDTRQVKEIIEKADNPTETLHTWTKILNNKHFTNYTPEQLQQILEQYG